jgi:hypothetical protein
MCIENVLFAKLKVTALAAKFTITFRSRMPLAVAFQRVFGFERTCTVAGLAFVRSLVGVGFEVNFQIARKRERAATVDAQEIFLGGSFSFVLLV